MIEKFEHITSAPDESIKLGILFSKFLRKGDVIGLNGDLGSGKTTFVKGILKGLNYKDDVTSPTFSLINEYDADIKVMHVDFYRDNNIDRWKNIGFHEIANNHNITIIEWPSLIPDLLPENIKNLMFEHLNENKRRIFLK